MCVCTTRTTPIFPHLPSPLPFPLLPIILLNDNPPCLFSSLHLLKTRHMRQSIKLNYSKQSLSLIECFPLCAHYDTPTLTFMFAG